MTTLSVLDLAPIVEGSDAGTVSHAMRQFIARTQADELIITTNMHDHQARLRSYEIVASIKNSLQPTTGAQDAQPAS